MCQAECRELAGNDLAWALYADHRNALECVCMSSHDKTDYEGGGWTHVGQDGMTAFGLVDTLSSGHREVDEEEKMGATYVQIPSMTFWQDELFIKRFAFPRIAISMALPTLSSRSSSLCCLANWMTLGSAPL